MDAVDCIGGDIHSALEAEGDIGSPDIVVDGLWKRYHVTAFLTEEIRCLMGTVTTEDNQTIQFPFLVIV